MSNKTREAARQRDRVEIINGAVCGCTFIGAGLAIRMIQSGDAEPAGAPDEMRIRLTFRALVVPKLQTRGDKTVKGSAPTAAIASIQKEALYHGSRREGSPVTSTLRTLRKLRNGNLVNWGEKEGFRERRFNPDHIPAPLYQTVSAWQKSRQQQAA